MQLISFAAIFFVVWWLSLFIVLPFGVRNQVDSGEITPGTEPGAPVLLRIWPKLVGTTVVAAVITALLFWGLSNPLLQEYWR